MTTTATYSMADVKTDHGAPQGMWAPYPSTSAAAAPTSRFNGTMEPSLAGSSSSATSPHSARPRSSHHHQVAAAAAVAAASATGAPDQHQYSYGRYSHEDHDPYDQRAHHQQHHAHPHPSLTSHSSFPSLKRTYSQAEQSSASGYPDSGLDMRGDEPSRPTVGQDHKLLSFKKTPDKYTILDSRNNVQQLEMSAQLHGMFFLSEMPPAGADGSVQPELTCYRRNLFQISGSLITPRGQMSVVLPDTGETVPVASTEVTISAMESVDHNAVRLIVIPWKTPPPNSPEISQGPDHEPPSLPLIPFNDEGNEAEGEYAVYPIGWRRLQFRVATANNGRRKELQQHFILHLKVVGTLANGSKLVLSESITSPIVVRGRSPRNFQARKEIPLLGSSAGSRGQALVETGLGIVAGPLAVKPSEAKLRGMEMQVPRSAFTFSAPKMPGTQMPAMRSNSYPAAFSPQSHVPLSQIPVSGPSSYPATTMASESPYPKLPLSSSGSYTTEPQEMPLQSQMPPVPLSMTGNDPQASIRTQYAYVPPTGPAPIATSDSALSVPRYVDSNPRPTKSPRNLTHDTIHSAGPISTESPSEYRYGSYGGGSDHTQHGHGHSSGHHAQSPYSADPSSAQSSAPTPREYYPSHSSTWGTSAASEASSTLAPYPSGHHHEGRSYTFPNAGYKASSTASASVTPTATGPPKADQPAHQAQAVYGTGAHSTYDSMNYWNGS
jgi:hypothetical protein